jgi:hypothetical protein
MDSSRHEPPPAPGVAAAISRHFEGDRLLYDAFAEACATQFAADSRAGEAAWAAGDSARLRRLSHDLASVLLVLGHADLGGLALQAERHAAADDLPAAAAPWQALHAALLQMHDLTQGWPRRADPH